MASFAQGWCTRYILPPHETTIEEAHKEAVAVMQARIHLLVIHWYTATNVNKKGNWSYIPHAGIRCWDFRDIYTCDD